MSADIVMPDGVAPMERAALWNGVEAAHKRGDATVAREFEIALPEELPPEERRRLAVDFAREVSNHYGVAADVCVHEPSKEGDQRNHHVHILLSACTVSADGFGKKAAELDPIHCQRQIPKVANPAELWRERWAELANERLREAGVEARIDHRSLEAQGIDREPSIHLGPQIMGMERRGVPSEVKRRIDAEVASRLQAAQEQGKRERELAATQQSIIDLSMDITAAKSQRLQDKIAAFELRADTMTAQREQAARQAAALAEQQRAEAHRAEIAREVAAGRALAELRKPQEAAQAAELARVERARAVLKQQQAAVAKRKRDNDYDMGGP